MRARAAGNDPSKLAAVTAAHAKAALARVSTAKGLLAKSAPKERLEAEAKVKAAEDECAQAAENARLQAQREAQWQAELARQKALEEQAARLAAEAAAQAQAKAEAERVAELARQEAEQAERERLAAEKAAEDRAERERQMAEQAERERLERLRAEEERKAAEVAEKARLEKEKAERDWLERAAKEWSRRPENRMGTFTLTIHDARDLASEFGGLLGKSDPYVAVQFAMGHGQDKFESKTKVIADTESPSWEETFEIAHTSLETVRRAEPRPHSAHRSRCTMQRTHRARATEH